MKKQFLRVKQIADQTFLRAEKSDVLTEDLLNAEKRVESIKLSCQATQKKIAACQIDFGSETSSEKRMRKIPQVLLGTSMLESGSSFSKNSVLGDTLRECSSVQTKLGSELFDYNNEVEKLVLKPISSVLDNEIHNLNKLRKQLGKLVLDMDSARTRFQTAEKHSLQASVNNNFNTVGKVDNLKEELEDASQKVDQCRDLLAAEMFSLISKEPQLAQLFVSLHQLQATYHRNTLMALEASLPVLEKIIQNFPQKPVYGCSLAEHLRVTNREVAQVLETSISFLLEYGIAEEGLLRIAGSASKLKKLKSTFDAGIEPDLGEFIRDPHVVSGALKSYLRELPEPLLTSALYDEWMNAAKVTDFEAKLQALWQVLHKLPAANLKNLRYVVKFLSKVLENVETNKMSSQNIAIVMAPNLIWSPTEDANTLGMNMSTASLHTSIIDTFISYCDWFFPECEDGSFPAIPPLASDEAEVNGNNLQVNGLDPCPSPRSPHKSLKKPAAPLPPAPKPSDDPSKSPVRPNPVGELIDLTDTASSKEFTPVSEQSKELVSNELCLLPGENKQPTIQSNELLTEASALQLETKRLHPTNHPRSLPKDCASEESKDSVSNKLLRRSNEATALPLETKIMHPTKRALPKDCPEESLNPNELLRRPNEIVISGETVTMRPQSEKPAIPDKPSSYSSCSLDRKSLRNNPRPMSRASRAGDPMTRSHIERPNVPPPDRPTKSPKFSSSENLTSLAECEGQTEVADSLRIKNCEEVISGNCPPLQQSRSSSKINRFDFLVNQREEKPPERPPRVTVLPSGEPQENRLEPGSSSGPGPVSPRSGEVEKPKPPRPQPPVPLKPKQLVQSENTNL